MTSLLENMRDTLRRSSTFDQYGGAHATAILGYQIGKCTSLKQNCSAMYSSKCFVHVKVSDKVSDNR